MAFCIECGIKLWPGAKFCAECGAKTPGAQQPTTLDVAKQISFAPLTPIAVPNRSAEEPIRPAGGSNAGKRPLMAANGLKKTISQPDVISRVHASSTPGTGGAIAAAPKKFSPVATNNSPPYVPPPPKRGLVTSADDVAQSPTVPARNKLTKSSPDVTRNVSPSPQSAASKFSVNVPSASPPVPRAVNFTESTIPAPRTPFVPPRTASPARVPNFEAPSTPSPQKFSAQTMPINIPSVAPRTGPLSPPRGTSPKAPFSEPPSTIPVPPRVANFTNTPPSRIPPPPMSPKSNLNANNGNYTVAEYDDNVPTQAVSPRRDFAMPGIPGSPKVSPRAPLAGFSPPIPIPRGAAPTLSPPMSPRGYGSPPPFYPVDDSEPPTDLPPPPPMGKRPAVGAPTKGWLLDPSRTAQESSGPVLIPIKGTSATVARQGDTKALPSSDNEVILTKTTYKADSNVAPLTLTSVNPGSIPKAPPKDSGKRMSFNTVVAMAVGHDGTGYQAKVVGHENRTENIDSSKIITVFKIEVSKGGQTWAVFRRHAQFAKLTQKLKEKKLLGYNEANLPSKKSDNEASVQALNGFLTGILSREEVATSHYMNNFLQPLQLGDIKPK